jgi:hypothetical protein
MKHGLQQYTVAGVLLHRTHGAPLVALRSRTNGSYLHLQAGPAEAGAILLELKGAYLPYPNAHDILASFFFRHRFKGKKLVISSVAEELPTATIEYRRGLRSFSEQLRPADGLALALRIGLPIYLTREAIRQAQPPAAERDTQESCAEPYLYIEQAHGA